MLAVSVRSGLIGVAGGYRAGGVWSPQCAIVGTYQEGGLCAWMKGTYWHGGDVLGGYFGSAVFQQVTLSLLWAHGHPRMETPLPEASPAAALGMKVASAVLSAP